MVSFAYANLFGTPLISEAERATFRCVVRALDPRFLHEDCFVSHVEARYAAERLLLAEHRPAPLP